LPGPGVNFNGLAHCDMASGMLAFVKKIVTHVEVLGTRKTPPGG
jgi:hypothetical protein